MQKMDKEKNFVSAVVYMNAHSTGVESFFRLLLSVLEDNFLHSEIICVNDGAKESDREAVRSVSSQADNVSISVLNMSRYHGVEVAMTAGVDLAIGDFVFEFDSTLADFEPATIMEVYRRSMQGADIVTAVPDRPQASSSRLFYYLFNKFSHNHYTLRTERFHLLSRRAINRISSMNKTIPYRKAVYMNCGFPLQCVVYPVVGGHTLSAESSRQENQYRERLAVDALLLFTDIGYRAAMALTKIMMLIAVLVGCYGVLTYFASTPVQGWTTTICFTAFAFFALFGILTIVVKYLQLILNLVFKRQEASFAGIEKLTK